MILRFLGQSGYILQSGKSMIIIDPYLSDSVNRVVGNLRLLPIPMAPQDIMCDAVICTHNHLDHLDPDTVQFITDNQFFITTNEGVEHLKAMGKTNVKALTVGESVEIGDFKITAVHANHTVEAFGLIVQAEGKTLYFSGDTLYDERLFEIAAYHPDVTCICINGRLGNMDVVQALAVAKKIGAKINIPNHYDMFASNAEDPHRFADHIDGGTILEYNRTYVF